MNLLKYNIEDFLENKSFVDYVLFNSHEDREFWNNFLSTHPEKKETFDMAKSILLGFKSNEKYFSDKDLDKLFSELKGKQPTPASFQVQSMKRNNLSWVPKIAAAIAFIVLAGIAYFQFSPPSDKNQEQTIAIIEKYNPKGQNSTIKLKDGSVVRLNAESTLKMPEQFESDLREVELIGEAFFEVAKDSNRPFIIKTGNFKTKVLGTSFNIRSYPEDAHVTVAVVTGKVKVIHIEMGQNENTEKEVFLTPNQMATYHKSSKEIKKGSFDPEDIIAWKEGVIYFHEAGFKEIIGVLERWYGVEFKVEKQVDFGQGFTGRFEKEALGTVLKGLSYSANFDFSIEKDIVYIK